MPQKVRQEGDVIAIIQEILRESVAESMGMDHLRVQAELIGKSLEPECQSARGNRMAVPIQEQVAAVFMFSPEPLFRLLPQFVGYVDPPDFSSFSI